MDEGWHAVCQAICKGIEGAECEKLYYKCVWHPRTSGKAKTLWNVREAKAKGDEYYDRGYTCRVW